MAARDITPRPLDTANTPPFARRRTGTVAAVVLAGIALLSSLAAGAAQAAPADNRTIPDSAPSRDHHLSVFAVLGLAVSGLAALGLGGSLDVAPVVTRVVLAVLFLVFGGWFILLGEGAPRDERTQD